MSKSKILPDLAMPNVWSGGTRTCYEAVKSCNSDSDAAEDNSGSELQEESAKPENGGAGCI
jgi:hypothetical protein